MGDFSNFLEVQTKTAWGRTLAEFASFCDPRPDAVILDIGCGPGLLPALFTQRGCRSFGVDYDFRLLVSRLASSLAQADAFHLPFPAASFDVVTATNLLFLLDDPFPALNEWRRVLVPSGEVCLLNPSENLSVVVARQLADDRELAGAARDSLLNWANNAEIHNRWTEAELRDLLTEAGFCLEESRLRVGPGFARFTRAKFC